MTGLPRRGSFFWTLSGAFLLVLLLVLIGQALVVLLVVEPATQRAQERRAEFVLERARGPIEEALRENQRRRVAAALRNAIDPGRPERLVLRTPDGRWMGSGVGRDGDRQLEAMWHRGAPPPEGPRGRRRTRGAPLRFIASVTLENEAVLAVVEPERRLRVLELLPRQALLFLPIGFVVAAAAGLFLSHRIQRRLGGLEDLARRVESGDLSARVTSPSEDEIGRLGRRLNAMTESLERARAELDDVQEQRRRLLADITHDLATPLTSIRGYAETLLDDGVPLEDSDRTRYLRDVLHASERMDRLLDDLLDLARLETGARALEPEVLDLAALARHATERFVPLFEKEGRALAWTGAEDEVRVHADGRRLEQVLDNLLGNALRHVPAGGRIEVDVSREDDTACLTVTDDGPGFDPSELSRVFDRFQRGDRSRSTPGSGLGLAIVREIARAHGGEARAENAPSGGARLVVTIPARPV